jgi:CheY-like chemotaxis protein
MGTIHCAEFCHTQQLLTEFRKQRKVEAPEAKKNLRVPWVRFKGPCRGKHPQENMCAATDRGNARILIISADIALSESRKAIAERDGWVVEVSRNKQHALAMLHKETFDLLILCNSLSLAAQLEFTTIFREKNPDGKIMAIVVRAVAEAPFDSTLMAPVTPGDFLQALRTLLSSD